MLYMNIICTFHIFMYGYVTEPRGKNFEKFIEIAEKLVLV